MTVHEIRQLGDPVLRTPAETVTTFDRDLRRLIDDMFESMYAAEGVGLAAPQIGVGLRIFVFDCAGRKGHVVNPELTVDDVESVVDEEGCLSVLGHYEPTPRAVGATVRGVDRLGRPVEVRGRAHLARCLQHETDHLNGTLYIDHLPKDVRRKIMSGLR
ncbi:peptide deformylase [Rhizohabitans arisaemae]|uniref:peptide deformylase n=1 Tax=Rhizohabitans arisaemae TaxID=2720610 RepID=UPI0024B06858|nr:peptide deformylase [Rhizohabitans arisaemae]